MSCLRCRICPASSGEIRAVLRVEHARRQAFRDALRSDQKAEFINGVAIYHSPRQNKRVANRFLNEAAASLSGVSRVSGTDEVYDEVTLQRMRLSHGQQIQVAASSVISSRSHRSLQGPVA
jgi:hypothetical protein